MEKTKTYPLLQSQVGVLLQSLQYPGSTHYNLPNYIFIPLSVTREQVVRAVQKLFESFPELHTRFVIGEDGEVRQWSDQSMPIPVVSRKCTEAELQAYIHKGFIRPFSLRECGGANKVLGDEPLFRVEVIETEQSLCLLSDGHHAIVDGMSFAPILTTAFATIVAGGSIEPQSYGLYQAAEDEVAAFGTEVYQRAKAYYTEKFAGLAMATLSHSQPGTMGQMGRYIATLDRRECDDRCREQGVQPNLLFQAAFGHVMSVLTRQEKVAYSSVNHGRMDKRLRGSVGMFVKSVPMLVNADPSQRVIDFVKSQRTELMSTIRYGAYPFTHFCSDLGMKPGVTFNFMAMANMEEYVMVNGVKARAVQPVRNETDSDLSVDIYLKDENYEIRVESSLAMNDADTLRMVAEAMRVAVCNMMAHPELTLGELDIVSAEEREALIKLGAGKQVDIDPQMTFVKAFEQYASQHPDRLAVADATDSLTYGELSRRSDVLAHRLIAGGVKPNDFVAVKLDRSIAFPLAVIAIHKAGAAYVPIDLEYPEDRRQYMLSDCQAKVIVDSQFMAETDFNQDATSIDLSTADGLAYMIYTSGSTGRPKGVMIRQANLWNFVQNFSHVTRMTAADRVAAHRSFSFDAHLKDLYAVLAQGGSLHIMPEQIRRDLDAIRQFIIDHRITVAGFTTSIGMLLLNTFDDLPIRLLSAGGERLHDVYSDHIVIVNCYGPTECTDDIFFYRVEPGERFHNVPIGRPVSNGFCFVVDAVGRLLPRGAVGELCFAGVQVSSGYWQLPELTAEKFTPCPFLPNTSNSQMPMYHTGDLVRWNADGLMEYVRRKDDQVKLRGYRIEFSEVESCASRFEGIKQAVAVVRSLAGSDTLCLYYTADEAGMAIDAGELRRFMAQTLADYMVPAAYMQLDSLPTTPNGKVDRRRLPEPTLQQETIVAPATELEQQLFDIVARQLGTVDFGVTTDLVTLGMSSIDAMRLSLAIGQQTGLKINVGELLANPTIRHMAETARRQQADVDLAEFYHEQDSYPLTANQRGVYIDWELNRDTTQYNVPVAICLGETDANRLADALRQVVDAHSYVKTRLERRDGSVVQLRRDDAPVQVSVSAADSEPDRDFFQQRVRPFNLFTDDLYRLEIYTYGGRTWLFRDFHHIVTDGLSDAIFFRDLLAALHGTQPKRETVTAFDYALYELQLGGTDRHAEARDYFDRLLAGAEAASYPRTANGTAHKVGSVTTTVADSDAIRNACRRMGITPNSFFQTVLSQVLHRLTRQERLMLATVSNGRSLTQTEDIMGMFVRTLPLVSVDDDAASTTFATAAQAIHRQSIESMNRDFYPLTEMVERHGLRPEILYAFEGDIYDPIAAAFGPDTDVIVPTLDTPKMPVEVMVYPDRQGVYTILLNFDTALYSQASMTALASALTCCATHATQEGILLGDIELTTDEQRAALVELGAGKRLDIDPQMTFVKAFERCASRVPDNIAVADADSSLTYGELSRRSDILAQRLIASGVKPDDFVAVKLDRTIDFPLAVIAIHKAGAAYVPIDLEYPEDRQQYMLSDCQARVVIDRQFIAETDFSQDVSPIDLSTANGLAYMIYTSGSTGKPKGAVLHQAGLWNFINVIIDVEHLTADDRISGHRSFSFDAHIEDLFPILTVGGSFHIMPEGIRKDLAAIRDYLFEHQITGGGYATPIATLLLNTYDDLPVRFITAGGEKLAGVYSDHIEIINVYGPTECTDDTSYYRIQPGCRVSNIPIGQTVANCYNFITDMQGRLLPRGAVGELCFAGIQVGRGYWRQPELTAEKFVDCPFVAENIDGTSVRMYHTGDLCRWNAEGELEYIGRTDEQVKLRGYRVELGEIEACANGFKGISQAVAIVRPIGGSDTLCLYYTTEDGTTIDADELRRFLERTLAEYMVPAAYIQLDELPLTPNGKVDRRRLPEPALQKEAIVAPATELEQQLFDIVATELETADFGVTTDLVTLGMSSIDAMRLSLTIGQQTGLKINVSEVLEHPTVRHMAETARSQQAASDIDLADFHHEQDSYPLTANQRGVYIDWELNRDTTQYNVPVAICLGQTDTNRLADALRLVVDAHSYIKTRLESRDGSVVQLRRDNAPVQVSVSAVDSEPDRDFFQQRVRPFNLFADDLYRLEIYTYDGRTWLFKDFHHIVSDGLSDAIFFRDLLAALHGTQPKKETVTAFDYALYELQLSSTDRHAEARNYFDALLAEAEAASYPRTANGTAHKVASITSTVADSEAIHKACRRMGITPNSYFQTVLAQVLHRLTRQEHLMLATVSSGRSLAQTEDIMGMFVKTLPLVSVEGDAAGTTFATAAQAIHRQSIESMSRDFYPLTEIVERHGLRPEILYAFEGGIYDNVAAAFSPDTDVIVPALDTPKMPVEVIVYPDPQGVYTILLNFDTALYSQASMTALASALTACATSAAKEGVLLSDIELTTDEQRAALVKMGAGKHLDIDTDKTYMDYFLQQAATCPDALAVSDATGSLNYSQLNRYSDLIADRLLSAEVKPHDFVAVMTERTRDFPVCVFGIHKAGAAYLPLDPAYPTDRLSYMLKDSGTRILVTTHALLDAKRHDDGLDVENVSVIYIDDINWEGDAAKSKPVNRCTPDGYTYIIYTSGSTGRPKGAVLHQKGLLNYVFSTIDELGLTSDDRISSHRSFSFDSHIEDLYPILLLGGSLHIMPEIIRKDLHGIYEFIVAHRVTGGGYPTSIAKLLVNTFDLPLRYVSAIGERLTGVVSRTCKIFNFYGPTECTDHISVYLLQQNREYENIPIGHVVANNWCFIVDTHDRLLPRGVVGELCIAGIQVGIGYWQRPELTAEKFVDCPFLRPFGSKRPEVERVTENIDGTPVRMYRTGDLCRWNADGDLEYIGRIDNQVKLRGYRVELGEIENCASRFEGISLAVAAIRPIRGTDTLCLYYTSVSDIDEQSLRDHLSRLLAEYMVPTAYMQLDALPLLPNGKVDRRRLPAIEQSLLHTDYVAPRNELEKLIVSGFQQVLNQDRISVNDDFVHLGGDSLAALKLVFSLGQSGVTVADVLSLRTPAAIASHARGVTVNLNRYTLESGCPLNNTQVFIYQDIVKYSKYDSYLMPVLIPIDRKYTDEQIRRALDAVFAAHPVLTMHVAMRDGEPYLVKGDKPAVMQGSLNPLKLLKLLMSGFDLYSSLSRHVIVRIPGRCYLLSVIHHLIFDVISHNVFYRHFQRALAGQSPLAEATTPHPQSQQRVDDHFLQIASFQQEVRATEQYAAMDQYIRSMLGNLSEANFYTNRGKHGRPGFHKLELGVDREQVSRFTSHYGITKTILFTAAMAKALSRLVGSDDVVFGFLDNGRDRFDNYEDIGLYINGMPLVAHVDHHDLRAYLTRLGEVYYKLSQHSYFPFAALAQEFNIAPIILFQFFPDWITEDGKYNHLPSSELLINAVLATQKDFMVEALVNVNEMKDCYMIEITYSGYYSRKMMKALAATYKKTLSEMVKVES